jgi:hypothetical protein
MTALYRYTYSHECNVVVYRNALIFSSVFPSWQFRMQLICLLLGMWSLRNVRRQRVVSASLFDQRRMRIQGSTTNSGDGGVQYGNNNNSNSNSMSNGGIHSSRLRRNSTEASVELTHHQQKYTGYGKVPKSPAPDINGQDSNMQTV